MYILFRSNGYFFTLKGDKCYIFFTYYFSVVVNVVVVFGQSLGCCFCYYVCVDYVCDDAHKGILDLVYCAVFPIYGHKLEMLFKGN